MKGVPKLQASIVLQDGPPPVHLCAPTSTYAQSNMQSICDVAIVTQSYVCICIQLQILTHTYAQFLIHIHTFTCIYTVLIPSYICIISLSHLCVHTLNTNLTLTHAPILNSFIYS